MTCIKSGKWALQGSFASFFFFAQMLKVHKRHILPDVGLVDTS